MRGDVTHGETAVERVVFLIRLLRSISRVNGIARNKMTLTHDCQAIGNFT